MLWKKRKAPFIATAAVLIGIVGTAGPSIAGVSTSHFFKKKEWVGHGSAYSSQSYDIRGGCTTWTCLYDVRDTSHYSRDFGSARTEVVATYGMSKMGPGGGEAGTGGVGFSVTEKDDDCIYDAYSTPRNNQRMDVVGSACKVESAWSAVDVDFVKTRGTHWRTTDYYWAKSTEIYRSHG